MFNNDKFNYVLDEFVNKKNSHSYIFYTNDFFACKEDITKLVKKIFNVENLNLVDSDYITIEKSDKKNILKEEIDILKKFFQKTSYINKNRVYLIEETHKLSSISANMILKFLEEPLDGVIGLYITTNLDAVLSTIKSRCQIINVFYDKTDTDFDCEEFSDIVNITTGNKYVSLFKAKKIFEKYDRNQLMDMFNNYLMYCYNDLNSNNNLKMIKKLNKVIGMLNNNVNVDYIFDYLLLGSGDDSENSFSKI